MSMMSPIWVIDVVLETSQQEPQERAEHPVRDHQQDRHRHRPALVERRQHQEHEHERQGEDVTGLAGGLLLLIGGLAPLVTETLGQGRGQRLHGRDGLTGAVTRRDVAVDGRRTVDVEALIVLGAVDRPDLHQGAERHHLAAGTAHVETPHVLRPCAQGGVRLGHDAEGAPVEVEIVDVKAAEKGLKGEEHVA
jgi:hypothetical protein